MTCRGRGGREITHRRTGSRPRNVYCRFGLRVEGAFMIRTGCRGLAALLLLSPSARADDLSLTRSVKGQVLTSAALPAVNLKFDKAFKYVGGQAFILYE